MKQAERPVEVRFIPIREVCARTSLSRSTVYALMAEQKFPRSIRVSAQSARWVSTEIDDWIKAKIAASRPVHAA